MLKKLKIIFPPVLLACLFSLLASLNLRTAIWFDEAYSAFLIRGNFGEIWASTAVDVHPPFYYFCLKIWSLIFGTSDFALRSMSVFFAALGIILCFFLLKRLFNLKTATVSTFFLSLSPFLIRYSEEMRMYGLVFFIVISATFALDYALKSKKKLPWLLYAVLISLGMWTHYFTSLVWLAHLIWIIYYYHQSKNLKSNLKTLILTYTFAVLLFLPWLPSFFTQVKTVQNGFWIPEVSLLTPFSFLTEALTLSSPEEVKNWLILPVLGVLFFSIFLARKTLKTLKSSEQNNLLFLCFLIFLPPLLLCLLSLPPLKSTYMTRYITYSSALLSALIGILFSYNIQKTSRKTGNYLSLLLLACFLICSVFGIHSTLTRENDSEPREVMTLANSLAETNEPILINAEPMDYYNLYFYETPSSPVYSFNVDFIWGSLDPIRNYQNTYLESPTDFLSSREKFIVIHSTSLDSPSFDSFEITSSYSTENFEVLEFSRLL